MKQKFLALVEEVKKTEIVGKLAALYDESDKEGFKAAWKKFSDDNQDLLGKIKYWASEFKYSECEAIFNEGESIENPMEIAVCIKIIDDYDVSECELFEYADDLPEAMEGIDNAFANAVAAYACYNLIYNMTTEDIFNNDCDEDSDEDEETESSDN